MFELGDKVSARDIDFGITIDNGVVVHITRPIGNETILYEVENLENHRTSMFYPHEVRALNNIRNEIKRHYA